MLLKNLTLPAAVTTAAVLFIATFPNSIHAQEERVTSGTLLAIGQERTTGSQKAQVVLIEFGDFQCPYCARLFSQAYPKIVENYITTGKVRYAFRHLPLPMHDHALEAAKAARCAAEQGQFWPMHDMLFANQHALSSEHLKSYASKLGLKMPAFEKCMAGDDVTQVIQADMAEAQKLGVRSTPTVFVGFVQPDSTVKIFSQISGARPYEDYSRVIDQAINTVPGQ